MAELKGPARIDRAKGLRERRLAGKIAMDQFQESVDKNAERITQDRKNLQKLKRQAYDSNEMAERMANVKKTGGKQIDEQIIEQITARGNELAKAHIEAYGPDGSPEMIAAYTKQKAQINKDLDDLTMFIGTLDAEIESRDKAIDDGTFIQQVDENGVEIIDSESEQFKNGVFNGESDVTLTYVPGQGYNLSGYNAMLPSPKNQNINLSEYAENIRKNGTSYKAISPNAEGGMDQYGMNLIDGLSSQMTDVISNVMTDQPNPNFNDSKPEDPKTNPKTLKAKTGYKSTDINKAKEGLTNALMSQQGFKGFTNAKGQSLKLPPEDQMWAQLQKAGYLDNRNLNYGSVTAVPTVSWNQYNNPDKETILKQAYADYLIDTQFQTLDPSGETIIENTTYNFGQGKVPLPKK